MIWLTLLYLFVALFVCSIGGGIGIARRLFSQSTLVLATSVGISGVFLYLAAGAIYLLGISWQWGFAITALCALAMAIEWRELRRWWKDPAARSMLIGWLLIEIWIVLANLEIRHFAIWIGDWVEHYERALFFLQHWAMSQQVYGPYAITARPPMMNLIEALFMGQSGSGYEFYQVAAGFLNAALYVAVAGLAIDWGGKRMGGLVAALMALSPWFVQNATYPWTKLFCAFYAVLGIWFYWRAISDEAAAESSRLKVMSLLMLTAGCLVHYSAAIVAVFIVFHDLFKHWPQWRRIVFSWAICGLLMVTWVGWVCATFGWRGATGNTTTVYEAQRNSATVLAKNIAENAAYSLIPRAILDPAATMHIVRSDEFFWSKFRDVIFLAYEPGLLLAWGVGGMVAMGWMLENARRERGKIFWIGLVSWIYVGGLLVCTPPSYYLGGVAHVLLQPVVWVGLAWLVSRSGRMPRWLLHVWWFGIFLDACWLMLHIGLEGRVLHYGIDPNTASRQTLDNAILQQFRGLQLLGMETISFNDLLLIALIAGALAWWWSLRREFRINSRRLSDHG
jgi:hypothetical protein